MTTYLDILPKDLLLLVEKYETFQLDYNQFIDYYQNKDCSDNLWREKGLLDFKNFDNMVGKNNKSKYLRLASRREFKLMFENVNNKLSVREAKYRHMAKLIDYNGFNDNRFSLNYIVKDTDIRKVKRRVKEYFNLPVGDEVLIFVYICSNRQPYYIIGSDGIRYVIKLFKGSENDVQRWFPKENILEVFKSFDRIVNKE